MAVDLLFKGAPLTGHPVNLVFGEDDAPPALDAVVSLVTSFPRLTGHIPVARVVTVGFAGAFQRLSGSIGVAYNSNTQRPDVNEVGVAWQDADRTQQPLAGVWQDTDPLTPEWRARWQAAVGLESTTHAAWQDVIRILEDAKGRYQDATGLQNSVGSEFEDTIRLRNDAASRFQEALPLRDHRESGFQDALRDRRNWTAGRFQDADPYSVALGTVFRTATPFELVRGVRYQEAMPPPPGIWVRPGPEPEEPCYLPVHPVHLLFKDGPGTTHLVFVCERHGPGPNPATVVVPIQRVYMVLNEATLRRVSDSALIPTLSMSMALDVDSWTWSFSAALPWQALSLVDGSEPTEVEATVNGMPYRFIVEKIGTERMFGRNSVRVSGRGKSALLDSPYSPSMFFGNTGSRTAQQLMGDVLTLNGVPLDWTINWEITDWTVPGNVWTHQGSYMSALTNIAAAPGAYIQPHPTAQELFVLPRYPVMPHQWSDLTPDFEIPSAVMTREGIERADLPQYDRVFVSGTTAGVLGQVTRAGTAGELIAPMVVDPLITHVDAARQRGLKELSAVGRQRNVTLRMPVLEDTGIIPPGKLVRYTDDGVVRLGFTRSVQVEVGLPDIWQSIGVETYA